MTTEELKTLSDRAYQQEIDRLAIRQQLEVHEFQLSEIETSIDMEVAFDTTLKNETERKAARSQLRFRHTDWAATNNAVLKEKHEHYAGVAKAQHSDREFLIGVLSFLQENNISNITPSFKTLVN